MTSPALASPRDLVRQAVRARVYEGSRRHNRIARLRQYRQTMARRAIWTAFLIQVRMFSIMRITSWLPPWLTAYRQQQPIQQRQIQPQPGDEGQPGDPRQLTVDRLVRMMDDPSSYVAHGTNRHEVGTLQVPLIGFEDPQVRISNPVAPVGVYGFKGLIAATDYGDCVVMHASRPWVQQGGHWFRPGTAAIPDDWIVGWCLSDDIRKARARRGQ